jgi:protein TonB
MKNESEQVQRWDDIIFENRNKSYGAYAIRKNYDKNVLKAEAISIGIGVLIFIIPMLMSSSKINVPVIDEPKGEVVLRQYDVNPEVQPPQPRQPRRATTSVIPTRVTTQPVIDEAPMDETPTTTASSSGTENGTEAPGPEVAGTGIGTEPVVETAKVFTYVEKMPEYEGGIEAMMKFIRKNVRYPRKAQQREVQGTVYVRFIVDAEGHIVNVEIEKGFDKECDAEAVRVISMLNKWQPGIQNNLPVAVRKILPITFRFNLD